MNGIIEVDVDAGNGNLHFLPLGRSVRGRFDFLQAKEKEARGFLDAYPHGVPGQRLRLNLATGEGAVIDPLHNEEHRELRTRLERQGHQLPPAVERLDKVHVPSWLFWLSRAIEDGLTKLVSGTIPKEIGGEPIRSAVGNHARDERDATIDRLTKLVERQGEQLQALLAKYQK